MEVNSFVVYFFAYVLLSLIYLYCFWFGKLIKSLSRLEDQSVFVDHVLYGTVRCHLHVLEAGWIYCFCSHVVDSCNQNIKAVYYGKRF